MLPLPQKFDIKGSSRLKYENIRSYHTFAEAEFPVSGKILQHIQAVDRESEAQILCHIDETLDIRSEGYTIDITDRQVCLIGKDKAGLFYALKTLEQLLEDAQEQDVCLPLCSIRDYPLLSFRAIHLDMKHHLEKKPYYYQLIDKLSKYKINAIIVEMEDKIHYSRRPELSSSDALSIKVQRLPKEFKELRKEFERIYSKSRVLDKPDGYFLDQDHHVHLANQTISFDWQFLAEMLFLKKIENTF